MARMQQVGGDPGSCIGTRFWLSSAPNGSSSRAALGVAGRYSNDTLQANPDEADR
jgi:hypothetical protein